MSKKFIKKIILASTISLVLLGAKENACGMMSWGELYEEDKKNMIEMHQGHLGYKRGSPEYLVTTNACRYSHQMDRYYNSDDAAMRDCRICRESMESMVEKSRQRRAKAHKKYLNRITIQDLKEENEDLKKININNEEKVKILEKEKEYLNSLISKLNIKIKDLKEERESLYSLTAEQDLTTYIKNVER